jgi:hypothetical protein
MAMSQQSRANTNGVAVKQESASRSSSAGSSFNNVNPQMLYQQQPQPSSQQQQPQQPQQPQPRPPQHQQQQQRQRPTPIMFIPNSSSALQHQYINDDSLATSSQFADNELAESLGGYGNLQLDPFTYATSPQPNDLNPQNHNHPNTNTFGFDPNTQNGIGIGAKSFPHRGLNTNPMYAASPSEFTSFSPEYGSPVPTTAGPIPFNRTTRHGQMSMSLPQFGGANSMQGHFPALMVGHGGSLTASPSTPGFPGSFGTGMSYDIDAEAAKYFLFPSQYPKYVFFSSYFP